MFKLNKYFIPYIFLLLILGFSGKLFVCFATVIFHEFVHYGTARFLGFSGFDVEVLPIGAVLKVRNLDEASPKEDFIISISGPLVNLILAAIFYYFNNEIFFYANFTIGVFNFLPALPLDGGRLLRDIFSTRTIFKKANEYSIKISLTIGCILMFLSLGLYYYGRFNMNLAIITLFIIYCSYKEKERIVYVIMGDIIKKKQKILNRGYMENKNLSVFYKQTLLYALSIIDKGRYNIFTILNENIEVIDIIYEQEIIDGLKEFGNITLEEFIKIREEII